MGLILFVGLVEIFRGLLLVECLSLLASIFDDVEELDEVDNEEEFDTKELADVDPIKWAGLLDEETPDEN